MKHTNKLAVLLLSLCFAVAPLAWAIHNQQQSPASDQNAATPEPSAPSQDAAGRRHPAKFLSGKDPDYSESAREKQVEGTVILAVAVNEKGKVTSVKVVNPLESSLDKRAIRAIKRWKFSPATLDGKPVASEFNVSVDFRLNR